MINLMLGDCLQRLKEIPDASVSAVITDPPYGMDYQSSRKTDKDKRFKKIANDKRPFIWFLHDAIRVLKDDGALVCFTDWKNQEAWRLAIEIVGFKVKSQVIWDREHHGMGDLSSAFGPQHDVIWFATKGSFKFPGMRPKSVVRSQRISGENLVHPNEKPVPLMESLINAVTKSGDTVLDPFMGSGATGIAAVNTHRSFIGFERDESYFDLSKKRIGYAQEIIAGDSQLEFPA